MPQRITNGYKKKNQSNRQGDWICLLCNNYNYSFRVNCNRCQIQSRQTNQSISLAYYDNNCYINSLKNVINPIFFQNSSIQSPDFPAVVFLSLDNEPWDFNRQDTNYRKDLTEVQNSPWINRLIED